MKKSKLVTCTFGFIAMFSLLSCQIPSYTGSNSGVTDTSATDEIPSADTSSITDTEAERETKDSYTVDVDLPEDYVRGFDASYVYYYETDCSKSYYETDGTQTDIFTILKNHGVNTVRLRLWVDPDNAVTNGVVDDSFTNSQGMNNLERTISLAARAKKAGLKVLLDFHYSDSWADPGKQIIPYSWQSITSATGMAEKISSYTTEVLTSMKDANCEPDYVQVGNEIDSGILLHTKYDGSSTTVASTTISGKVGTDNFTAYLKAGCTAVRSFNSDIKIILHVTNRKPTSVITQSISSSLDYDILGLSYYPWESSHGTIASLRENVKNFKDTYKKDVMVVESSMYWNYGEYDSNYSDLSYAAQHLIDPDTSTIYSDLTTATVTYNSTDTTIVEGSISNQANSFRHIIEESADCGALGIFAWGGDMQGEWKYAFFDYDGKAMKSLDIFNVNTSE